MSGPVRRLPTTVAGAEFGLVLAFVSLRAFDLLQLAVAFPGSLKESPAVQLDLALVLVFAGWSTALCWILYQRRRFDSPRLVLVDVLVGAAILAATPLFTLPADRFSSWASWGYAVTLSVAVGAGVGLRRWRQTLLAVCLLSGLYLAAALPGVTTSPQTLTALTNSLAYLMFAVVIRLPAGYMRRLSADADAARDQAATLAQETERARHRRLLHDHASLMTLLSRDDVSPALVAAARAQAASGATQVRRFLDDEPEPLTSLGERLLAVATEFSDLDPAVNIDRLTEPVPDDVADAVAAAVRTVLHNVRVHAGASHVVVYAATPPGTWEVQVSDDGRGFTAEATPEGFGLRDQVRAPIVACGGQVRIVSSPGEGTIVQLGGIIP